LVKIEFTILVKIANKIYRNPAVEAEDSIGFLDRVPALDIGELTTMGLTGADLPVIEITLQRQPLSC
jgi:hypothetical protein